MKQVPAEELAHMLEDWWSAMTVAFARIGAAGHTTIGEGDDEDDPEPLLVIALRSQGEREAVHYRLGGEFIAFPLVPPAISIGSVDGYRGREVLKHELAHALLHQYLPRVPHWLDPLKRGFGTRGTWMLCVAK